MSRYNLADFINKQVEVAVSIEKVRMAEKFITEKQMHFEMQYAIDLLHQALLGLEKLSKIPEQNLVSSNIFELEDSWLEVQQ